jgi:hypothetical protein
VVEGTMMMVVEGTVSCGGGGPWYSGLFEEKINSLDEGPFVS